MKENDEALYVKKQLKVIFNIPRFTIAYEIMTVFFSQVHSINLVDHIHKTSTNFFY
jgi:hypothetical protein